MKFRCLIAAAIILTVSCGAVFFGSGAAQSELAAKKITNSVAVSVRSGKNLSDLTDSDIYTTVSFSDPDIINVKVKGNAGEAKQIAGVYVIWNVAPGNWQLKAGDAVLEQGRHGFIHEYVALPEPASELTITVSGGAEMCDLEFYTAGKLPEGVQIWSDPWEKADFLLFPSHGDDEHLFFGGIIPYYAGERGYKVQIAYFTDHKYTQKYRVHEQLDALWTSGVRAYPCFGDFVDKYSSSIAEAEEMYGADNVERWQVEMIRRFKPLVVVGHDFDGEYGHGAHRLNGTMLQKSVPDAADPEKYTDSAAKYGVWDTPKFYSHLYNRDNGVIIEWDDVILSRFGGVSALEMAKRAFRCHVSQQSTRYYVMTEGYGDCRQFGLFRSTVGDDVLKTDLLENLIPVEELINTAATAEPTETLTPAPTAEPTEMPTPTPTTEPTKTPSTTATPEPTETPTPDPTAVLLITVLIAAGAGTFMIALIC